MGTPKPGRKGDWIQTSTGRAFFVTDPRAEDVQPLDIAHGLAAEPRFNGQTPAGPYSVGQHSILVSLRVEEIATDLRFDADEVRTLSFVGLIHDAAEAYAKDIPRPLKRDLTGYDEIEGRILSCVFDRFAVGGYLGSGYTLPALVKRADDEVLVSEAKTLHPEHTRPLPWGLRAVSAGPGYEAAALPWAFADVKRIWLDRFVELGGYSRAAAWSFANTLEHDRGFACAR